MNEMTPETFAVVVQRLLSTLYPEQAVEVGSQPDGPDAHVAVYDTGGPSDQLPANRQASTVFERVSCQLRVRNLEYSAAADMIWQMLRYLEKLPRTESGNASYMSFHRMGQPLWLMFDQRRRAIWVVNVEAKRQVTEASP